MNLLSFFNQSYRRFLKAEKKSSHQIQYSIGGRRVDIRFAGTHLVPLVSPALSHLKGKKGSRTHLTLCAWEGESFDGKLNPPHLNEKQIQSLIVNGTKSGNRIFAFYDVNSDILSLYDTRRRVGLYWTATWKHFPSFERARPFHVLFNWWLPDIHGHLVHAAAVGFKTGGVVLAGRGGAGKSTIALSSLSSPLLYLSDDYCFLTGSTSPLVQSLYSSGKLFVKQGRRFPHLHSTRANARDLSSDRKSLFFLQKSHPKKIVSQFPLRAILIPKINKTRTTSIAPATTGEAVRALLPSTLFQLPGERVAKFQHVARITRRVPVFTLKTGSDLKQIPKAIAQLLKQLQ